jgi:hypothetical protein
MKYRIRYQVIHQHWLFTQLAVRECLTAYAAFHRAVELQRLVDWATRKRLTGPRRSYAYQLFDAENRLHRYAFRHPHIAFWVLPLLFGLHELTTLRTGAYRHGAAAKYRQNRHRSYAVIHNRIATVSNVGTRPVDRRIALASSLLQDRHLPYRNVTAKS